MDGVVRIPTDDLEDPAALRALLDAAFDGGFRDADWRHALGGWHFLRGGESAPIAHAAVVERTLVVEDREVLAAYVESVATHPDHQHRGHGTAVMEAVGAFIEERYRLGALSAGIPAFYERFGWQLWRGPSFVRRGTALHPTPDDDGTVMVLATSTSAPFDVTRPISCQWREGEVW